LGMSFSNFDRNSSNVIGCLATPFCKAQPSCIAAA
jgi:hypothetical protein